MADAGRPELAALLVTPQTPSGALPAVKTSATRALGLGGLAGWDRIATREAPPTHPAAWRVGIRDSRQRRAGGVTRVVTTTITTTAA